MLKQHKLALILTSIITILPALLGLCIWNILPEKIPIHFDINGNPDGFANKAISVFVLPFSMLAVHWLCIICTAFLDPKSKNNLSSKAFNLVLWISPIISLVISAILYSYALGYEINTVLVLNLLVGVMFIVIGILLPKCKQSYTIGIKLPWTLNDENNWNKTHRFGGVVFVIGGTVICATSFLNSFWIMLGVMIVMIALPIIYSLAFYLKTKKAKISENPNIKPEEKSDKNIK